MNQVDHLSLVLRVQQGAYCWSHSYYDGDGDWQPCKPNGFGETWNYGSPSDNAHLETCGTACTEFASDQDDDRPN